jgi:endonuclease III
MTDNPRGDVHRAMVYPDQKIAELIEINVRLRGQVAALREEGQAMRDVIHGMSMHPAKPETMCGALRLLVKAYDTNVSAALAELMEEPNDAND